MPDNERIFIDLLGDLDEELARLHSLLEEGRWDEANRLADALVDKPIPVSTEMERLIEADWLDDERRRERSAAARRDEATIRASVREQRRLAQEEHKAFALMSEQQAKAEQARQEAQEADRARRAAIARRDSVDYAKGAPRRRKAEPAKLDEMATWEATLARWAADWKMVEERMPDVHERIEALR